MNVISLLLTALLLAWQDPLAVQESIEGIVIPRPVHDVAGAFWKMADATGKFADAFPWCCFWVSITLLLAPLVRVLAQHLSDRLKAKP